MTFFSGIISLTPALGFENDDTLYDPNIEKIDNDFVEPVSDHLDTEDSDDPDSDNEIIIFGEENDGLFLLDSEEEDEDDDSSLPMGVFTKPNATQVWSITDDSPDETDFYGGGEYNWDQSSLTLTLHDVNHTTSAAVALSLPDGATLVLIGDNTLSSTNSDFGSIGLSCDGDLIISSDSEGSLTAIGGGAVSGSGISIGSGSLVIDGDAIVAAKSMATYRSYGINLSSSSLLITGDTKVTASGGITSGDFNGSFGIYSPNSEITVEGNAVLKVIGNGEYSSYGICYCLNLYVTDNAVVTAESSGGAALRQSFWRSCCGSCCSMLMSTCFMSDGQKIRRGRPRLLPYLSLPIRRNRRNRCRNLT